MPEARDPGVGSGRAYARVRELGRAWLRGVRAGTSAGPPAEGERSAAGPRAREHPAGETPVFFVTGLGKSGTRWLTKILDAHPEVVCRGEGRFFSAGWRRNDLDPAEDGHALVSSLYHALTHSDLLRLWVERSVWTRDGDPDEHMDALMRLATEHFLLEGLAGTGKRLVGDKSPLFDAEFVREVSAVFPGAKVIHIIRDGRDRTVSSMHRMWRRAGQGYAHRMTPEELARGEEGGGMFTEERLRQAARNWSHLVGRTVEEGPVLLGPGYAEVRYEDLLERPHTEVGRLLGFLGASTDEKTVEHCVSSASFEKLSKGRQPGEEDPSSFYRKGIAGDWRNHFTERDKRIFKEEAGDLLVRLGYEKDLGW